MTPGEARGYLARFLFRGDDAFKEVRTLSGGERSRLELALLGIMPANLLLLDEPTNHLDIPAREAIEAFLRETPATLLVVSHDRRLLETVCDRLWVVDDGAAAPFDGGYRAWRAAVADGWTVGGGDRGRGAPAPDGWPAGRRDGGRGTGAGRAVGRDRAVRRRRRRDPDPGPHRVRRRPRRPGPGSPAARSASPRHRVRRGRRSAAPGERRSRSSRRRRTAARRRRSRPSSPASACARATSSWRWATRRVGANFVELRRITSELADVTVALEAAEESWLAARGAGAVTGRASPGRRPVSGSGSPGRSAAASRPSPAAWRPRGGRDRRGPPRPRGERRGRRARPRRDRRRGSDRGSSAPTARSTGRRSAGSSSPTRLSSAPSRRSSSRPSGRGSPRRSPRPRRRGARPSSSRRSGSSRRATSTMVDEIWFVTCEPAAQRARLAGARPDATADTERRVASQAELLASARHAVATRILVDGRRSRSDRRAPVDALLAISRSRARRADASGLGGGRRGGGGGRRRRGRRRASTGDPALARRVDLRDRQPVALDDRLVVSPSRDASTGRVSSGGRRARLNEAVPVAWRWLISSASASGTFMT